MKRILVLTLIILISLAGVGWADDIIAQQTSDTGTDWNPIYGQAFICEVSGKKITSVTFWFGNSGYPTGPSGTAVAKLYAATGTPGVDGKPDGSALATSEQIDLKDIELAASFTFSGINQVTLTNGNNYFIAVETSGSTTGVSYRVNYPSIDSDQNFAWNNSGTWTVVDVYDLRFILYGTDAVPRSPGTFYMSSTGTAANITAATGVAHPDNYMNVAVHNAATFIPGDTIYLSDKGGTFVMNPTTHLGIIAPSSGTAANPIIYTNATGESPVIDMSWDVDTGTGWSNSGGGVYSKTCAFVEPPRVVWEDGDALAIALQKVSNGWFTSLPDTAWTWGTGWAAGSDPNFGAIHTPGNTAALEQNIATTAGATYKLRFTIADRTAGSVTPSVGGTNYTARSTNATFDECVEASNTDNLKFTPSTDFDGRIVFVEIFKFTPGTWYYVGGSSILNYYPTTGTPGSHETLEVVETVDANMSPYGFDLRERSYIEASGLTFNRAGVGVGNNLSSPVESTMSGIKVHDCTFNYSLWAIYGNAYNAAKNAVFKDSEFYNNTINYSNCGISVWNNSIDTTHTNRPENVKIYNNTIKHHFSIDSTNNWVYTIGNATPDHEAISFQDAVNCEVTGNTITTEVPLNTSSRAIFNYTNANFTTGSNNNIIAFNKVTGAYDRAINFSGGGTKGEGNKIYCNTVNNPYTTGTTGNCAIYAEIIGNESDGMNYICNNTIYSAKAVSAGIELYSNSGKWTIKNNIISVGQYCIIAEAATKADYVLSNNNYHTGGLHNGTTQVDWDTWKGYGWDTDGSFANQDPVLRMTDLAITNLSPTTVKSGNATISGITYSGSRGLPGVDGKLFSVSSPAMGAFASPSPIYLTTFGKNRILNHILSGK